MAALDQVLHDPVLSRCKPLESVNIDICVLYTCKPGDILCSTFHLVTAMRSIARTLGAISRIDQTDIPQLLAHIFHLFHQLLGFDQTGTKLRGHRKQTGQHIGTGGRIFIIFQIGLYCPDSLIHQQDTSALIYGQQLFSCLLQGTVSQLRKGHDLSQQTGTIAPLAKQTFLGTVGMGFGHQDQLPASMDDPITDHAVDLVNIILPSGRTDQLQHSFPPVFFFAMLIL